MVERLGELLMNGDSQACPPTRTSQDEDVHVLYLGEAPEKAHAPDCKKIYTGQIVTQPRVVNARAHASCPGVKTLRRHGTGNAVRPLHYTQVRAASPSLNSLGCPRMYVALIGYFPSKLGTLLPRQTSSRGLRRS